MKQIKQVSLFFSLLLLFVLASCRKDDSKIEPIPEPTVERKGIYVLSEGLFNANNSSLTYFDYENRELTLDLFSKVNGRGLGDTGNDIRVYGSKMYIVVNVSSTLEVIETKSGKSLKKLDLKNESIGRQPRYVVFNQNKAFISNFDGTVAVLDTATLNIEKYIPVGRNPEQMAIANGKLYVANSGGLDYPNYDKTVSVIDLNTLTEIKKITVVENPRGVAADQYGDVYILSTGNYDEIKPSMTIIDSKTDEIKSQSNFSAGSFVIHGDHAYLTSSGGAIKIYNVKTETIEKENFISDGTKITTPYGIAVDDLTGEVFITDAKNYTTNGEVFCFDQDGNKKYSIKAGINPNSVVFVNK